jgi:hypothetical protein
LPILFGHSAGRSDSETPLAEPELFAASHENNRRAGELLHEAELHLADVKKNRAGAEAEPEKIDENEQDGEP